MADEMGFDTLCLHGAYKPDTSVTYGIGQGAPRGVPLHRTTPYQFVDTKHAADLFSLAKLGNIYTRLNNPTTHVLESRYAMMEGGHPLSGLCVASGTNAVFYSLINLARQGDNIVSSRALYGGTYTQFEEILPQFGITVKFVDAEDPENFLKATDSKTRAWFCESCSNPALEICDLEAISKLAHSANGTGLPVDVVVSSLTKWVGGHGTAIGGIIVDSGRFKWGAGNHPLYDEPDPSYGGEAGLRWGHDLPEGLAPLAYKLRALTVPLRNLGGCISPDNSWMVLQGIETLSLRMERHCENAMKVAKHLKMNPAIAWVRYPGLEDDPQHAKAQKYLKGKGGSMVVFGIKAKDGKAAGSAFIDSLDLISHVANVGDARTLAIHPATTTHSQMNPTAQLGAGVKPEMVRLSVGLETAKDIIADIDQALAKAMKAKASCTTA
jgi:O-acetylhomoserine (thiol)-lyase